MSTNQSNNGDREFPVPLIWRANYALFTAVLAFFAVMSLWAIATLNILTLFATVIAVILAVSASWGGIRFLRREYLARCLEWLSRIPTNQRFTAKWATMAELEAIGMLEPNGRLLGTTLGGYALFAPSKVDNTFTYVLAPQGGYKTSARVLNSALYYIQQVKAGKCSVWINDAKPEVGEMIIDMCRYLDVKVVINNPARIREDICPHTEINTLQHIIGSYLSLDDVRRKDTTSYLRRFAEQTSPVPGEKSQNPFFGTNGNVTMFILTGNQVVRHGNRASVSNIYSDLTIPDEAEAIIDFWCKPLKPGMNNAVCQEIQNNALIIKKLIDGDNEDYFPQFLAHAREKIRSFDPAGHLAGTGAGATVSYADARKEPMVIIHRSPLKHAKDFETYNSLHVDALVLAAKDNPTGLPLHLIIDEFQTLHLPFWSDEMLVMRGLGITAEMYVQSRKMLAVKLGKEKAATVWDQSDVKILSAIDNTEDAKDAQLMLGSNTERALHVNARYQREEDLGFNYTDEEKPLKTIDQLLTMPPYEQIIKIRGQNPIIGHVVPYWRSGLKGWFGPNPLHGGTTPDEPNMVELGISDEGLELISPTPPKDLSVFEEKPEPKPPIVKATSFIWLYLWIVIFMASNNAFGMSVPALRYSWKQTITTGVFKLTQRECRYVSMTGNKFKIYDLDCPWITMN